MSRRGRRVEKSACREVKVDYGLLWLACGLEMTRRGSGMACRGSALVWK